MRNMFIYLISGKRVAKNVNNDKHSYKDYYISKTRNSTETVQISNRLPS